MRRLELLIEKVVVFIEILSIGLIFLCVIGQVTFRFVFQSPLPWPEELARIFFIYLVFIGAAEVSRERSHIAIDLKDVFHISAKVDRYFDLFRQGLMLIVLGVIVHGAYVIIPTGYYMNLPATGLPMSVMSIPVLIGALLMLFWVAVHLVRDLSSLKTNTSAGVSS